MASQRLQTTLRQLVTANHVLHYHGAVDGFGHVSVRHPEKPNIYILCGYMPLALVEKAEDLVEYYVDGSEPVDPAAKKGYSERCIHGELFAKYPNVQCVVHSHAGAVIPYASSTAPLKPMYHMGGFMGHQVPVWDITTAYSEDGHQQDMLVDNVPLGASLAASFSPSGFEAPQQNVVLMKRHGYTTWGKDIPTAVYRAVYTLINAGVQTKANLLQAAMRDGSTLEGLSERHYSECQKMTEATQDKSSRLWSTEVEAPPLCRNSIPEAA